MLPPAGSWRCSRRRSPSRSCRSSHGNLFSYGIFILIYALLALGLNVVVGFAGLLDLGYVAFFGFGAYIYAFLASHQREATGTHHWDASLDPVASRSARCSGSSSARRRAGCSATTSRSSRSSSARRSWCSHNATASPPYRDSTYRGSNGLANVDPLRFFGDHVAIDTTRGYYWFLLGVVVLVADRAPLRQRVPDRARLEGARARIRSRPS